MPMRSCSTKISQPITAMTMKRIRTMRKMTMFSFIVKFDYVGWNKEGVGVRKECRRG